jgi:glycolate oxidase
MEIKESDFESVYESFISQLELVKEEDFFSLDETKCKELRVAVPRSIFEANSKMGVVKQGTDVQVLGADFEALLKYYRKLSELGVEYNLFGHFGDGHLHFNFMPTPSLVDTCQKALKDLYRELPKWKASPFAEHGIGLLKRPYIEAFYTSTQEAFFEILKSKYDPKNQFFPHGFMQPRLGEES